MKDNTAIHKLARPGVKSGKVTFVHFQDGTTHTFYTCVNDLSGSRMSWFDNDPPDVDESMEYIRSVFRGIFKKATKIIEVVGDFQPPTPGVSNEKAVRRRVRTKRSGSAEA